MAYNHSEKIGNQGDVLKHAVLAAVVAERVSQLSDDETFVYAESHTAYPEYTLPELARDRKKGWPSGIGLLAGRCGLEWPESLQPYLSAAFNTSLREAHEGRRRSDEIVRGSDNYPGSSVLTFRLMEDRRFHFTLYDVNSSACSELAEFFPLWDRVRIRREDGWAGILDCESASLVLIDPPSLEFQHLVETIQCLTEREIPFLVWTPRIGNSGNASKNIPPSEGREYIRFRETIQCEFGVSPILARWHENWRTETCGCCLHVFPKGLNRIANSVAQDVRRIMQWNEQ